MLDMIAAYFSVIYKGYITSNTCKKECKDKGRPLARQDC